MGILTTEKYPILDLSNLTTVYIFNLEVNMGKNDNRRTFKMKRKKAQTAKKARLKAHIAAAKTPVKSTKK